MSKCWYCNNELTSEDSPKHFGIYNQCYDEMFKSGDTIIRSLTNKIAELQKQLEEKEKEIDEFKRIGEKGHLNNLLEDKRKENRILIKIGEQLLQQLKSQSAEIVEKIKEYINTNAYYYEEECFAEHINSYLDEILKEYGGE